MNQSIMVPEYSRENHSANHRSFTGFWRRGKIFYGQRCTPKKQLTGAILFKKKLEKGEEEEGFKLEI